MPKSPFLPYYNAIISVRSSIADVELDPVTGNYTEKTTPNFIDYLAFLKQKKLTESAGFKSFYNAGLDEGSVEVHGYLVNPQFFPTDSIFPSCFPCRVRFGDGKLFAEGTITLSFVIGSAVNSDLITGQPITGIWRTLALK